MLHTIFNKHLKVQFNDELGEVCAVDFDGIPTLKAPGYGTWAKTWPVMFPICGKLKDNKYLHHAKVYEMAGHGFFRSLKWEVTVADDHLSLHANAVNCDDFLPVYPFRFTLALTLSVHENVFSFKMRVQNIGDAPMYFNSGHHEAFLVDPASYSIALPSPATFTKYMAAGGTGPALGPVGMLNGKNLDLASDCSYQTVASGVNHAVLHSGKGYAARLHFKDFRVLTLWARPHSDWICIEPWNGTQDVGNEQPRELALKPLVLTLTPKECHEDVFKIAYERE